jgi:hypothetical protein
MSIPPELTAATIIFSAATCIARLRAANETGNRILSPDLPVEHAFLARVATRIVNEASTAPSTT